MDLKSLLQIQFCNSSEQMARDSFKICSKRKMLASGSALTNMRTGVSGFGRMCRICHEVTSGIPYLCPPFLVNIYHHCCGSSWFVVLTLHKFKKCVNDHIPINVDFGTTCFSEPNKFFFWFLFLSLSQVSPLSVHKLILHPKNRDWGSSAL